NPFVDETILLQRKTIAGISSAWRALRAKRFDLAVDFQGLLKSALVASVAHPDHIFGFHQSLLRERLAALFYSDRVLAKTAHVVDRNLELATAAGASSVVHAFPLPEGTPEGDLPDGEFILANPLAGWPGKQWPMEYYAELAGSVRREFGVPLVLNGPPQARDLLSRVPEALVNISGIPGLIYATRKARAVVGIDSGPMHLAAALGKPGVAIFGPTDPARNGPYGGTFRTLRSAQAVTSYKRRHEVEPCMREIAPRDVLEALREQFSLQNLSLGCSG
ncbi:MAG: glycosyltransferase family 9 protein, partial [Bryobacteraceae bacterium]